MPTTRDRLLLAVAQLLDDSGGAGVSTRAICERAGVTAPTLYHHFGSKQRLVDEVLQHGFTQYVTAGRSADAGDPIDAVRAGWDAHVRFGLTRPASYVLLHARIGPGVPSGITGPAITTLTRLLQPAAAAGRLRVPPGRAAAQILAANVGATLSLIAEPAATRDLTLSEHLREAVIAAVTVPAAPAPARTRAAAARTPRAEWPAEVIGMIDGTRVPALRQVVLDTTDARALAEFYRELLGLVYRPGDEVPPDSGDDERGRDWLVLRTPDGVPQLAFQQVAELTAATWPDPAVPQQLHLDLTVASAEELRAQHDRVRELGGRLLYDRMDDPDEPLQVFADPSGHPFCIFVA